MSYWLLQVTPSPSPSVGSTLTQYFDLKDYVTGIAIFVSTALLVVFRKRVGSWVADRWQRLRTPLDKRAVAPAPARPLRAKSFHDRQIGAPTPEEIEEDEAYAENRAFVRNRLQSPEQAWKNVEDLGRSLRATQLSEVAKANRPTLPARWKVSADWDVLGRVAIENVGPGDASHVLVTSSVTEAAIRDGYWASFPKHTAQPFLVDPPGWVVGEDFYLQVTWYDEADQKQSQDLNIPRPAQ